jgi:hypothetical protein
LAVGIYRVVTFAADLKPWLVDDFVTPRGDRREAEGARGGRVQVPPAGVFGKEQARKEKV